MKYEVKLGKDLLRLGGQDLRPVQTSPLEDPSPPPQLYLHIVSTEVCTAGKWAVWLLLACFLANVMYAHFYGNPSI